MPKGNNEDVFDLSDEDFLNAQPPVVEPEQAVVETPETPVADATGEAADSNNQAAADDTGNDADPEDANQNDDGGEDQGDGGEKKPDAKDPSASDAEGGAEATEGAEGGKADDADGNADPKPEDKANKEPPVEGEQQAETEGGEAAQEEQVNYQEAYEKIMAPFQANGKTITLNTPEEAIKLMQQGANYTRKMQAIQPHRRVLQMLQNNNLLDESRLGFLIDIDKKDPEAVKKLIKDSGIDPLEIDVSSESTYREGNHRVSDEEVQFTAVLEDLAASTTGQELIRDVRTNWDQHSREEAWKNPELLTRLQEQNDVGIYGLITAEMDRQKTLGIISPQTPFLTAYNQVGDSLHKAGKFDELVSKPKTESATPGQQPVQPQTEKQVLAVKAAQPKQAVATDSDRARAAAPSRSTPRKAAPIINPLAMSDEDFLKLGPPT